MDTYRENAQNIKMCSAELKDLRYTNGYHHLNQWTSSKYHHSAKKMKCHPLNFDLFGLSQHCKVQQIL